MVTASVITTYSIVGVLLVAAIIYKIGFAPGNLWASRFVGGIGLGCALWFYVLLKVAPVTFVGGIIPLVLFSVLSFFVGIVSIGGSILLTTFLYWRRLVGVVWLLLNDSVRMIWLYYIVYSVIISAVLLYPLTSDIGVFSFAGLPPFALFFAKVLVLGCAIVGLGVILVASAIRSIVYYSRWLLSARVDRTTIGTQSTGYI